MKLIEFSVGNYRSITSAHKIKLQDMTVLVGKNNEGKSNLLKALNVAMTAVIQHSRTRNSGNNLLFKRTKIYDWNRDFPMQLQKRKSGRESRFRLIFQLDENEISQLYKIAKIRGNGEIPISVIIGSDNNPKVEVPKKGSSSYSQKSAQITEFISNRIFFNYIQAIRTDEMAIRALQNVIINELSQLDENEAYKQAQKQLQKLEQKVLDRIAKQLIAPLKAFLPSLNNVEINTTEEFHRYNRYYFNDFDVIINDGQPTSISNKGDGIKSLVTLAILKDRRHFNGASVIAIEEPESHLHSGAIHSLVDIINKMSLNSQVIITTHNPLFVQQNKISSNIIVDKGTARTAKNIAEIRDILGVLPSDNLQNARFVLVVEGEEDKMALSKLLPYYSEDIKNAIRNNILFIKPLDGAGNLAHDLLDLKNNICKYVVLMDNDKAGKEAANKALEKGLLREAQIRYTICNGSPESEFKDCIKPELYSEKLKDEFCIDIRSPQFHSNLKWSERIKNVFLSKGAACDEKTIKRGGLSSQVQRS